MREEDIQVANKHKKRCSTLLIFKITILNTNSNHNEIPLRIYFESPFKRLFIPGADEDMEKLELSSAAVGNVNGAASSKDSFQFLKYLKIQLPDNPTILLLDTHPDGNICHYKDYTNIYSIFICNNP